MWTQWHLLQYHLACVYTDHVQSPTECSPVILCCYYVAHVSGVLAEIPAHPGVSVILPVFCGFVFKKRFKSSVKVTALFHPYIHQQPPRFLGKKRLPKFSVIFFFH